MEFLFIVSEFCLSHDFTTLRLFAVCYLLFSIYFLHNSRTRSVFLLVSNRSKYIQYFENSLMCNVQVHHVIVRFISNEKLCNV